MTDRITAVDWGNILRLLMLTMLSDGRIYEREADSFVDASVKLRGEVIVRGMQTRSMTMEWYIEHRRELIDMQSGETFESDLLNLIDSLEGVPDKKPLIRAMKNLSRPEFGRRDCMDSVIGKSRNRWALG